MSISDNAIIEGGFNPSEYERQPDDCYYAERVGIVKAFCSENYSAVFVNLKQPGFTKLCDEHAQSYKEAFPNWRELVVEVSRTDWEASGQEAEIEAEVAKRRETPIEIPLTRDELNIIGNCMAIAHGSMSHNVAVAAKFLGILRSQWGTSQVLKLAQRLARIEEDLKNSDVI